jgi:large subunit ribosomal protein L9
MMVDVVLLERVEHLGQMGQVVKVKPGYARNFLLPQRKALRATKANMVQFENQRVQLEATNLRLKGEAEQVAQKMAGLTVIVIRQAGESGQLYGSVTARDVAEVIQQASFTVERRQVSLETPIKTLGLHAVKVSLHPEVSVTITANVAQSADEAEAQAKGLPTARDARDDDELEDEAATVEAAAVEAAAEDEATEE